MPAAFGFYGKLPGEGDFVSRRLPWEFTSAWDDWMQQGLVASRHALGGRWLELYLSAPVWRFQIAAGVSSDGIIGPNTLRAIKARPSAQLVTDLLHMRLSYLRTRPTWPAFGDGWQKRCLRVAFAAGRMAGATP